MRGAPSEETITPFISRGFNETNTKKLQKIHKAWNKVGRKDKELRGGKCRYLLKRSYDGITSRRLYSDVVS